MKIAIVYDRINKYGGAERILENIHSIWPDAPLYTAVYDRKNTKWADNFDIRTTFLQKIPFANQNHEIFSLLTPMAFETLVFDKYDVVISVTSADAKSIITKPDTLHICYCLTPTRYLWSGYDSYLRNPGLGGLDIGIPYLLSKLSPILRKWDKINANRPDTYFAISKLVKQRINKYYGREVSQIIYPPVNTDIFHIKNTKEQTGKYFLSVSRFVGYKRIDLLIKTFNELGLPLVVVGNGRDEKKLKSIAKSNIRFVLNNLTDEELVDYYSGCRAFVFAGEEDFGLAAAEAQACGKPVIAFRNSGIAEIIIEGKTGLLFDIQNIETIKQTVKSFRDADFLPDECRKSGLRFSNKVFMNSFLHATQNAYQEWGRGIKL